MINLIQLPGTSEEVKRWPGTPSNRANKPILLYTLGGDLTIWQLQVMSLYARPAGTAVAKLWPATLSALRLCDLSTISCGACAKGLNRRLRNLACYRGLPTMLLEIQPSHRKPQQRNTKTGSLKTTRKLSPWSSISVWVGYP